MGQEPSQPPGSKRAELYENPAYLLSLASNAMQRTIRRALHPLSLTHVQYVVLAATNLLSEDGAVVTQTEVCRFGSLDPNMVSEIVGNLVTRGLLVRLGHPKDRRAKQLQLTDSGRELLLQAKDIVRPLAYAFFDVLGDDRKEFARMLRIVVDANFSCEDD